MRRVDQLIFDRRAQALRITACVEQDRRTRIRAVAVHALQIAAPPGSIIWTARGAAPIRWIRPDPFDEYQRVIPAVRSGVAKDRGSGALRCQAPIFTSRSGDTGRGEWIRVRVDCW